MSPTTETSPAFELGPELKKPTWTTTSWCILKHMWRKNRTQILILIIGVIVLGASCWCIPELKPPVHLSSLADLFEKTECTTASSTANSTEKVSLQSLLSWIKKIEFVFGFFTALIAAFVWHGEMRENWEQGLPSVMSVIFFHEGNPVIVCRNTWLAGPDDLRNWGQQVASQAITSKHYPSPQRLDFNPDIRSLPPSICEMPNGNLCTQYVIGFTLTKLPSLLHDKEVKGQKICLYQNLLSAKNTAPNVSVYEVDVNDPVVKNIPEVVELRGE